MKHDIESLILLVDHRGQTGHRKIVVSIEYWRDGHSMSCTRLATLNGWHCPAVDCVFGTRNGFGAGRGQKRDEIGDFFRFCRTAERYPSKAVHDDLLSTLIICAGLFCETLRQADGRFRLDPARRDTQD